MSIPPGALPRDTPITITEIAAPAPGAIGKAFDIGPSGTQFALPITLAFTYDPAGLGDVDPTSLEVATVANGDWQGLGGPTLDAASHVVAGQTTHLSPYGVHAKKKDGAQDGGATSDAASTDASSADGATLDAGFDASNCTKVSQQVGSCMNHPIQICSGGKVFTNCVDQTPMGYTAYCCPP